MTPIATTIATELDIRPAQVEATLALFAEGATVPFVARYRKERTGDLDEVQLRQIAERYQYLTELEDRRQTVLTEIESQGKLTDALKAAILACQQKTELEDLYLPYRPKRRTRATMAKEKGLEPLAQKIEELNRTGKRAVLLQEAQSFVNPDKGVQSTDEALQGAADILAEQVAERAELRRYVRDRLLNHGQFTASIKKGHPEGSTKYEMYRAYQAPVRSIASHNLLALLRGDREGILKVGLEVEPDPILQTLEKRVVKTPVPEIRQFYRGVIQDAYSRLMKPSLTSEVMAEKKAWADEVSIQNFEANLKNLLLSPPAGMKPTLGVDPGFRTGCKVAAVDSTGKFLEYQAVFPHQSQNQRQQAAQTLAGMIRKHKIELIAIGNGTASRETDAFVGEVLKTLSNPPVKVLVNESGASIYSASEVAAAEFPDLDVTVRGAISIARRLQDPLAELVKIDPKSIGVGQYQHDVDQKRLKQKLDDTIESCVNYVGVDLNMASRELLTYVSGLTPAVANNIVEFRDANGAFHSRRELLKVKKLGPKAFEQAAGFLRIRNGKNPLDNTAVHPESYGIVDAIAADLSLPLTQIPKAADRLKRLDIKKYTTAEAGELTLRDILQELEKPGRDPREQFAYARFQDGINEITDLKPGLTLEGVVTNVTNFGAFVDVGVHQDGLVHISQMADRFVSDPNEIVKVGQVVMVRVMEVDTKLKRIGLSMRAAS
ncbi:MULTISPECIES: Tex family protein [Cyanophyceae]|uniref:Tex family protein n=1 Tax=Cyanophyceae TaxID=3028117 RepID=UPI00168A01CA|nr:MULTISPECIES: Tex family protein [Cyanophyceae]MBD1918743.1 RNA-binding transcriptional accessory protein [Phormidium sp. FACHB-77]MBD2033396.1 RNA-binding transcriptional accessory protein [Phormidium sp. FACHB-322]MBD2053895.1 RNA-binding transcriptional accessory protein [Leptolyngbya sp. FACHB-60]